MIHHLEFTLNEVFIWETVDKKDLLVVAERDKEYDFYQSLCYMKCLLQEL